jgi:hypothetical protein
LPCFLCQDARPLQVSGNSNRHGNSNTTATSNRTGNSNSRKEEHEETKGMKNGNCLM